MVYFSEPWSKKFVWLRSFCLSSTRECQFEITYHRKEEVFYGLTGHYVTLEIGEMSAEKERTGFGAEAASQPTKCSLSAVCIGLQTQVDLQRVCSQP